jgi:hypothetical protein
MTCKLASSWLQADLGTASGAFFQRKNKAVRAKFALFREGAPVATQKDGH